MSSGFNIPSSSANTANNDGNKRIPTKIVTIKKTETLKFLTFIIKLSDWRPKHQFDTIISVIVIFFFKYKIIRNVKT